MATRSTRSRRRKKKSAMISSDYIYDFSCLPCSDDGKNNEAKYQCVECQQYYCRRCLDFHSQLMKDHMILDASVTYTKHEEASVEEQQQEEENEACEFHHGEVVNMYCHRHDIVCCDVCVSISHRFCPRVESVKDVTFKSQHVSKDVIHDLQEIATDLQDLKSKQQALYEDVNQKRSNIKIHIQKYKAELIRKAEELEKSSLKDIERRSEAITTDLDQDIERVSKILQEVERDQTKTMPQYGNEAKRFVNLKLAQQRLSERKDAVTEVFGKPIERIDDFSIHPAMEKYFTDYESLGSLSISRKTLAPFVNIVIPVAIRGSKQLRIRLNSDLQKIGIRSKDVNVSDIVADVYTIVIISCMNDLRNLRVDRKQHQYIILLRLDETPDVERSLFEKMNDYLAVPLGEQFVNFVNWADVALKTSISFHRSYHSFNECVFDQSDMKSALSKIADITEEKMQVVMFNSC